MAGPSFDHTNSNLVLMVGGQVLWIIIVLFMVVFGVDPITSPFVEASKMVKGIPSQNKNNV
jgi:hypothetical protein